VKIEEIEKSINTEVVYVEAGAFVLGNLETGRIVDVAQDRTERINVPKDLMSKLFAVAKAAKIVNQYLGEDHPGEKQLTEALEDLERE